MVRESVFHTLIGIVSSPSAVPFLSDLTHLLIYVLNWFFCNIKRSAKKTDSVLLPLLYLCSWISRFQNTCIWRLSSSFPFFWISCCQDTIACCLSFCYLVKSSRTRNRLVISDALYTTYTTSTLSLMWVLSHALQASSSTYFFRLRPDKLLYENSIATLILGVVWF